MLGRAYGVIVGSCVVLVVGCYDPTLVDCRVRCAQPTDCAGEQVCDEAGWCVAPAMAGQCNAIQDADRTDSDVDVDAGPDPVDARPSLCEQGCPGTCDGDVCVIDCSAPNACSSVDVQCPINLPCRVVCGPNACDHKIQCRDSVSCEVQCTGNNSCADEVLCPTGRCTVSCSGDSSCAKRIKCKESCACDVVCSGPGSCGETQECPDDGACALGAGCTSQLPGCDDC